MQNSIWNTVDDFRPGSYVALSSNLIQTNLIERIKCDNSASYETSKIRPMN